jgi:hypothetical protein
MPLWNCVQGVVCSSMRARHACKSAVHVRPFSAQDVVLPCSGGVAGEGLSTAQATSRRRGFSEQDQEDLYMSSHGGKSQGRAGLGVGGLPKKVAGARWAGTKTRLDSDSEAEPEVCGRIDY